MRDLTAFVDNREPPFGVLLLSDNLTCDIGDDRPHSRNLGLRFGEPDEGFEVYDDVDRRLPRAFSEMSALQQVEEYIGPKLIHPPRVTCCLEAPGDLVEIFGYRPHSLGRKLHADQVRCAIRIRPSYHSPFVYRVFIDLLNNMTSGVLGKMERARRDDPRPDRKAASMKPGAIESKSSGIT